MKSYLILYNQSEKFDLKLIKAKSFSEAENLFFLSFKTSLQLPIIVQISLGS